MRASYWHQMAKLAAGVKRERMYLAPQVFTLEAQHCLPPQKHKVGKHSQPGKVNECQIEKQMHLFNSKMTLCCSCLSHLSLLLLCDQPDSRNSILLLLYLPVLTRMFEFERVMKAQ